MDVQTFYSPIHNDTICAPGATPFFQVDLENLRLLLLLHVFHGYLKRKKNFFILNLRFLKTFSVKGNFILTWEQVDSCILLMK